MTYNLIQVLCLSDKFLVILRKVSIFSFQQRLKAENPSEAAPKTKHRCLSAAKVKCSVPDG